MFSVVIPLYNKELSIQNTIKSVLQQSFQEFEIVVVNDGSTDASVARVEEIDDSRIRVVHQKNQGVSAARNKGVAEAKFSWIAFLDGDDLWKTNHLEEIKKMMCVFPKEKVYVTSFEYSDKREVFKHPRKALVFKVENYFKEAMKENIVWSSNVVIHKSCFRSVGAFNEIIKYGEDLDLWARLASVFAIIKSSAVTATYRVDAENRSILNQKLQNCIEYHISLDSISNEHAHEYFSFLINQKLYSFLRSGNFKTFFELRKKQSKTNFTFFLIKKILLF